MDVLREALAGLFRVGVESVGADMGDGEPPFEFGDGVDPFRPQVGVDATKCLGEAGVSSCREVEFFRVGDDKEGFGLGKGEEGKCSGVEFGTRNRLFPRSMRSE